MAQVFVEQVTPKLADIKEVIADTGCKAAIDAMYAEWTQAQQQTFVSIVCHPKTKKYLSKLLAKIVDLHRVLDIHKLTSLVYKELFSGNKERDIASATYVVTSGHYGIDRLTQRIIALQWCIVDAIKEGYKLDEKNINNYFKVYC